MADFGFTNYSGIFIKLFNNGAIKGFSLFVFRTY